MLYPPALPAPPLLRDSFCTGPQNPPLPPGQRPSRTVRVVFRGDRIRGLIYIDCRSPTGVTLQLHLYSARMPRLSFLSANGLSAVFSDVARADARAPLYYSDWYTCKVKGPVLVGGQRFDTGPVLGAAFPLLSVTGEVGEWTRVKSGSALSPGCAHPLQWFVAAARLNHPVVVARV